MACGCELRGAPARQNSIYLPGVYASLAGLQGLGDAASDTAQAVATTENFMSETRRQTDKWQRISTTISSVVGLIVSAINFIPFDSNIKSTIRDVAAWVSTVTTGRVSGSLSSQTLDSIADFCRFVNNLRLTPEGVGQELAGAVGLFGGTDQQQADAREVGTFIGELSQRLCTSPALQSRLSPPAAPPTAPQTLAFYNERMLAARQAYISAKALRDIVEGGLLARSATTLKIGGLLVTPSLRAAQASDCWTSCAMKNAYASAVAAGVPAAALTLGIPAAQKANAANGYVRVAPASSCDCAAAASVDVVALSRRDVAAGGGATSSEFTLTTGGGGGGGGGGAGIAIAGAGLLAALMFFRR
jgi:hypothetical protein